LSPYWAARTASAFGKEPALGVSSASWETVPNMGVLTSPRGRPAGGRGWNGGMTIELSSADGTKQTHEVAHGGGTDPHSPLDPLGLTLNDGKMVLAGVERHLVRGRVAEYSALRRRCSHCQSLRPLKDTRARRLNSLIGTAEVPAPRFKPCRCAPAMRSTLAPASELMQTGAPPNTSGHWRSWGLVAISPCPAVPVRVLPYRR
jgi:hypothetical protein